ncbi:MAG: peptidylprolyl isomerase [Acidobacteriaceae bacterium]|nr:peptidylprolyl isomerase [Acidobacteriaceae bacterium]MBV9764015.1 peptidylprolyl isomerase [Acidobacteriaceae bacterium]
MQTKSSAARPARRPAAPALPPVALPSEPGLYAVIYTSMGNIVCRLLENEAPKTVANFRALARGTKPWTDPTTGALKHTPLYSGTTFHRVIPQFMIQGGDPAGTGSGGPGYEFEDEIDPNHVFDKPGILAMANSGPNTNGSQFFITVAPTPWLNGKHTIFGEVVTGQDVADAISQVPRDENDKPVTPVKIVAIAIRTVPAATRAAPK